MRENPKVQVWVGVILTISVLYLGLDTFLDKHFLNSQDPDAGRILGTLELIGVPGIIWYTRNAYKKLKAGRQENSK